MLKPFFRHSLNFTDTRILFLAFVVVIFLSACQVDSSVSIEVEENGSGTVTVSVGLDDSALDEIGDLDKQLQLGDLSGTAWSVSKPVKLDTDSKTVITASTKFEGAEGLSSALAQIAGPSVFSGTELSLEKTFAKNVWSIKGKINLSKGLNLFSDSALDEVLDGYLFGRTLEDLTFLMGCEPPCDQINNFFMDLSVSLPGSSDKEDGTQTWTVPLGDQTSTPFELSTTVDYPKPRTWRVAGFVFIGMALSALLFGALRQNRFHQKNPESHKKLKTQKKLAKITKASSATEKENNDRSINLVVVGGKGVIWDAGSDPEGLLIPFVRENGGLLSSDEIADRYRAASLGQVSAAEFWLGVGLTSDSDELDRQYLSLVKLRSDTKPFLEQMKSHGIPVACVTNSVLSWSYHLRENLGVSDQIDYWIVSGEVGARKPSNSIFEALRRTTGISFINMLFVDSDLATLEVARGLGISTVFMQGTMPTPSGLVHPKIHGFAGLFGNSSEN